VVTCVIIFFRIFKFSRENTAGEEVSVCVF